MGIDEQRSYGYTLTVSKLSGPRSAPFIQMQAGDLYHLGDTDFVPAMKLARREGVQVIIASISGRFSTHLLAHSDEHRIVKI